MGSSICLVDYSERHNIKFKYCVLEGVCYRFLYSRGKCIHCEFIPTMNIRLSAWENICIHKILLQTVWIMWIKSIIWHFQCCSVGICIHHFLCGFVPNWGRGQGGVWLVVVYGKSEKVGKLCATSIMMRDEIINLNYYELKWSYDECHTSCYLFISLCYIFWVNGI